MSHNSVNLNSDLSYAKFDQDTLRGNSQRLPPPTNRYQ